jgi:hypothetical protein
MRPSWTLLLNCGLISLAALSAQAADNTPAPGFVALFNGKDLTGWKGLVANPPARAKMSPEQLAKAQEAADRLVREHWKVEDGVLVYDGKANSLCTARDYGDFELLVDWKIGKGGDSGIYLRGSTQVQIWKNKVGSGGLYNNQRPENPRNPLKVADKPVGEWNTFRIKMVGEKVWVWLNGELVVDCSTACRRWSAWRVRPPSGLGRLAWEFRRPSGPA